MQALIVWHVDRLYRSMKDLERLIDIADAARVKIRTVQGGDLDLSTSAGRMVARILGSVARQESEHKGERQRLANDQRAAAGHWVTCNRTFGYTPEGNPWSRKRPQCVRPSSTSSRASNSGCDREWNAAGLTTTLAGQERKEDTDKNGRRIKAGTVDGKWNSPRVRRVLINPKYAGILVHRGKEVGKGNWTPLIDLDTHKGLVAYLSNPARITNPNSFERKYLGPGVYRCGICGATMMTARPGGKNPGKRRYVCRNTPHLARVGQPIDDLVTAAMLER